MQQPKNWGESEGWEEERWGVCQMICGGGRERVRMRYLEFFWGEGRWKAEQWRKHKKWGRGGRWEARSNNWEVTFGTRVCQNVEINSMAPNQGSYRQRSDGWMQTGGIKRKFCWQEAQMCFLYLIYVLVLWRENPQMLWDLMGEGGSGHQAVMLIKYQSRYIV